MTKLRETIINAIPEQLKLAVAAGIGLFIAFIGFQNAGIVVESEATLVAIGNLRDPNTLLTIFGLVVTALFLIKGFKGGVFYGMIVTSIAGIVVGLIELPSQMVGSIPDLRQHLVLLLLTYPIS